MKRFRLSFIFLFAAFFCAASGNPLLGFGKRGDDKAEVGEQDEKAAINVPSTAKSASETTTTTLGPSSSCGGLKDFLHICNKNEPTESTKTVKTRSVPEKESDESSDDSKSVDDSDESDDSDDSDDSDGGSKAKGKKQETTETSSVVSEPVEGGIVKRQVEDPEAFMLGEVPPVISDPIQPSEEPIENPEEVKVKEKRQVEDSNSNSNSKEDSTEEILDGSRRRRDCRDRDAYYGKNCRRKREFVPSCFDLACKKVGKTAKENQ